MWRKQTKLVIKSTSNKQVHKGQKGQKTNVKTKQQKRGIKES